MSREKRTVFIVVLTLIVYSVSQFLETGEFIFPFPIFDSILLLIFFQFIYWNRKEIFEYSKEFDWVNIIQNYYLPNVEKVIAS